MPHTLPVDRALDLSIILPVFNESQNLPLLWAELCQVLAEVPGRTEIIFVDDASTDGSAAIVRDIASADPRVRLLPLAAHAGLSAAFAAGFDAARGDVIVTLDADLQNDPRDIPRLLAHLGEADLVQGYRIERRDPWLKRLSSRSFNAVRDRILGERLRDSTCSLRVMRRQCLDELPLFNGFHRFVASLLGARGYRIVQVPVSHRPRRHGTSKFGVHNRLWVTLGDLLVLRWTLAHQPDRRSALSPALAIVALWVMVALSLGAWSVIGLPAPGGAGDGTEWSVLAERPDGSILTVWVHWQAPRGSTAWVALEPGQPWPDAGESYWRRRVLPGWNQLVWDDFTGFPRNHPVHLRALAGEGHWTVVPAAVSSGYTLGHLRHVSGLLVTLVLGGVVIGRFAWRRAAVGGARGVDPWHLALLAVAVLGLGLRLYTLTTQSFWFDEVLTAIGAQSFAWVLYSPQVFGHPPLQYLIAWAVGGAHASEGLMRAPFVGAGVAAVLAVGLLGRRVLGASTGLVAAVLLAISPFHVSLSQLARPYSLIVLGAALSWLMLFRALERGRALDWISFSVLAALSCYAHYLAGMTLVAQALVAVTWVARRRGANGLRAAVSFAAIAVLLAPAATALTHFVSRQVGGGHAPGPTLAEFVRGALMYELLGSGAGAAVTAGLLLLGLWQMRHRPDIALSVLAVLVVPLAILWAVNPTQPLAGRYFAFVLPMLVLAVAHGLVTAARVPGRVLAWLVGPYPGVSRRAATACAAVTLILAGYLPARATEYYRGRLGNDWRSVAQVLDRSVGPGDEVVATLGALYPLRHYWRDTVSEVDGQTLWARYRPAAAPRRLWIITLEGWDHAPDLQQWLQAHAIQVGEVSPSWSLPRVYIHRARGELM